jgi:hypothetical protein
MLFNNIIVMIIIMMVIMMIINVAVDHNNIRNYDDNMRQ